MAKTNAEKLAYPCKEAAAQLSMSVEQFTDFVECGALPPPKVFYGRKGAVELWPRAALEAVLNATNVETDDFEP